MTPKKYLAQIKKIRGEMNKLTPARRRSLAWQMLLNETVRKDKEGIKWLVDNFYTLIVNSKADLS